MANSQAAMTIQPFSYRFGTSDLPHFSRLQMQTSPNQRDAYSQNWTRMNVVFVVIEVHQPCLGNYKKDLLFNLPKVCRHSIHGAIASRIRLIRKKDLSVGIPTRAGQPNPISSSRQLTHWNWPDILASYTRKIVGCEDSSLKVKKLKDNRLSRR